MKDKDQTKALRRKHYGWRKVEEELPREIFDEETEIGEGCSENVLVRTAAGSIVSAWYDYGKHGWYTFGIGKDRCGYLEFLTKYDDIHDDTVIEWRPLPGHEQGAWLSTEFYKPKPGAYEKIEVSWLEGPDEEHDWAYDIFFYDDEQNAWVACSNGHEHEFTFWRPLQEHNH